MIDLVGKNGAFNDLYSSYRGRARKKGFEFTLTKLEFFLLTSAPCYYCGKKPEQSKAPNKYAAEYIYNGIDRLDNAKGYIDGNVVPCCYDLTSQLVMGNVNDQSLREIWINSKYKNLRDSIKNKKFISICNNCATVKPPVYLIPNWS